VANYKVSTSTTKWQQQMKAREKGQDKDNKRDQSTSINLIKIQSSIKGGTKKSVIV
jgi:hypothetical protein